MTTGATKVVGIIGWPVEGSLSPTIHGAAFRALGLDWAYVPLPVEPDDLPAALAGLPALGLRGASVTMPHKTRTASLVDDRVDDAATLGAVIRTISQPTSASAIDCRTVAATSWVSDVVIDCTRIGWTPPTPTSPTRTSRVGRRTVWKREVQ